MTDRLVASLRIVDGARTRLSGELASLKASARNRSMIEVATNPMRRSPRTDSILEQDGDRAAHAALRRAISELAAAAASDERVRKVVADVFAITSFEGGSRGLSVETAGGSRLPFERWAAATGRCYRGQGPRSALEDLARLREGLARAIVRTSPADPGEPEEDEPRESGPLRP